MLMLTLEGYTDLVGPDQNVTSENYPAYYRDAEAELHLATFDRLRYDWQGLKTETIARIQAALAELIKTAASADQLAADQKANPIITDERVGEWSVKYSKPSTAGGAEIYGPTTARRIIAKHLLHTGLLYRGDYEGGLPYDL